MTSNPSLHFSFPLNNYEPSVCAGAFCEAFEALQWQIKSVQTNYGLSGAIKTLAEGSEDAIVSIKLENQSEFLIELAATNDTISDDYLKECQKQLVTITSKILDESLQLELEAEYKRRLQDNDIALLKNDKRSVFKWAYGLLFTTHPAQMVAWVGIINIIVFIAMTIAGVGFMDTDINKAIEWGAADKQHVLQGEYWRLLTACFIHFGFGHIAGNMIGLLYASFILMLVINRWQFLFGYLATGIISMAFSIYWHNDTVTAGASGAIFGCYGILMGVALTPILKKADRVSIFVYLIFFAGFNLLYGLKDGIDNAAHVAGLLSGAVIGLMYVLPMKFSRNKILQPLSVIFAILFGLGCSAFIIHKSTYYAFEFNRLDSNYSKLEHEALEYYRVNDTIADVEIELLQSGVDKFNGALRCVDTMQQIPGKPEDIIVYTNRLKAYTIYRLAEMDLILRSYKEDTNTYKDSIGIMNEKVDSLLKAMKQ